MSQIQDYFANRPEDRIVFPKVPVAHKPIKYWDENLQAEVREIGGVKFHHSEPAEQGIAVLKDRTGRPVGEVHADGYVKSYGLQIGDLVKIEDGVAKTADLGDMFVGAVTGVNPNDNTVTISTRNSQGGFGQTSPTITLSTQPKERVPTGICKHCGGWIEDNDGIWWTFGTCRSMCSADGKGMGRMHEPTPNLTRQDVADMYGNQSSPPVIIEEREPVKRGRAKSDAARKVFG